MAAPASFSQEIENQHYSLLGDSSRTVGHGGVNFNHMPGGYVTDSVMLNSLTVGLSDYFEIGIMPWAYASGDIVEHTFAAKLNFFKTENWQLGAGFSQIKLGNDQTSDSESFSTDVESENTLLSL